MKEIIDVIKTMEEMRDFNYAVSFKVNTDTYNAIYGTDYSTNKIQAQVTKAVKGGSLDRTVVKGVVYFTIKNMVTPADTDTDEE